MDACINSNDDSKIASEQQIAAENELKSSTTTSIIPSFPEAQALLPHSKITSKLHPPSIASSTASRAINAMKSKSSGVAAAPSNATDYYGFKVISNNGAGKAMDSLSSKPPSLASISGSHCDAALCVVFHTSSPTSSKNGGKFCTLKVTDFTTTLDVRIFGSAFEAHWTLINEVIVILNATISVSAAVPRPFYRLVR